MNKNLTNTQNDYAVFLPALSGFYATYVGKQRFETYVDPARIPSNFTNGIESLNYLNAKEGQFTYKWTLYSAGHADLDVNKVVPKEDMIRNRDRENTWVLGDSGGFQIGKGVWEGEWRDPNSKVVQDRLADYANRKTEKRKVFTKVKEKDGTETLVEKEIEVDLVKEYQAKLDAAQKKRDAVLRWMDAYMDYGMILDIPAWVARSPAGIAATGISSYQDAVEATKYNNKYWMQHRTGSCKFLNVLQGENHAEADDWYEQMKDFCDPKKYPSNHFNGWAMGGQNMCDVHLVLKRIVVLHYDGLLESGVHDFMHFLGTSKLEWALLLTDVQRAVRKYYNPTFTITFDCASPFLATANGQVYIQNETPDRGKWTYRMVPSVDDKKYSSDQRLFKDAVVNDGIFKNFENSPITDGLKINDVCIYGHGVPNVNAATDEKISISSLYENLEYLNNPKYWIKMGDTNKIGKVGKTSWDSFSYAIQMGHNVWSHINAVQEANRQYDAGLVPKMLVQEKFDQVFFNDIIEKIFSAKTKEESLDLIDQYSYFWVAIPGTRGAIGKKTINGSTSFKNFFSSPNTTEKVEDGEFNEEQEHKLEDLENEQL
jgi:hypothetical protein